MNFSGFHPFTTLFFFGACCKWGGHLNISTVPLCCVPATYCHLSATLQTMSIIVVNLQDNQAVFQIFIALLRFSFDSPSYVGSLVTAYQLLGLSSVLQTTGFKSSTFHKKGWQH
jgi:hypothetical protein